jgi:Ca2+-binding EF-hand superfamily protein
MGMSGIGSMMGGQMPNLSAIRDKMFQKANSNGDKGISIEEFLEVGKKMPDGKAGIDDAKAKEAFGKIDADKNGSLSQEEMATFFDKMSNELRGAMIDMQANIGGMGKPNPMQMFGKADADGNGSVSRSEFDKSRDKDPISQLFGEDSDQDAFSRVDTDGDGSVSREEFDAFGQQMKDKMQAMMGGNASQLMETMNAYGAGSSSKDASSDLTSKLLEMLKNGDKTKDRADRHA